MTQNELVRELWNTIETTIASGTGMAAMLDSMTVRKVQVHHKNEGFEPRLVVSGKMTFRFDTEQYR